MTEAHVCEQLTEVEAERRRTEPAILIAVERLNSTPLGHTFAVYTGVRFH